MTATERTACPFYGFHLSQNVHAALFVDSQGNQCAAVTGGYVPCQMEVRGLAPAWNQCPLRTVGQPLVNIERLRGCGRVYPREGPTDGVPFGEWMAARLAQEVDPNSDAAHMRVYADRLRAAAEGCKCGQGAVDENPDCPVHRWK
jgi:hypothetical protein